MLQNKLIRFGRGGSQFKRELVPVRTWNIENRLVVREITRALDRAERHAKWWKLASRQAVQISVCRITMFRGISQMLRGISKIIICAVS